MTPRTLSLTLIVVIVVAVVLAIGILLGSVLKPAGPAASPTPAATREPPRVTTEGPPRPAVDTHRLVQEAINAQDVNALKARMADTVQYVISATECCGPLPRGEALAQLRGRLNEGPFDFSPTNPSVQTIRRLVTSLAEYAMGVSASRVLAYRLNDRLLIDAVYEADIRLFGAPER